MKQRDLFWSLLWGASHRFMRWGKPMRHRLTAGILILVLVAQFGCASSGTDKRLALEQLPSLPKDAVLHVAVTSGRFAPTFDIVETSGPETSGCTYDRPEGFGCFLKGLLITEIYVILYLPLFAALVPVMLITETVKAIMPEPTVETAEPAVKVEKRKAREATARELIASQRLQDDLRDRVVGIGGSMTPHVFEGMTDRGPSTRGEQPDYLSLSQEGVQAVLEVVIENVTLQRSGDGSLVDPQLGLVMTVNSRLIRLVDNVEFYFYPNKRTYNRKSLRTLAEWVSDPESFRNELNQAYTDIAERIVKGVFLGTESN